MSGDRLLGGDTRMRNLLLVAYMVIVNVGGAHAGDAYVCKLFAREYLRVVYAHNLKLFGNKGQQQQSDPANTTADTTKLPFYYKKLIDTCLGSDKIPNLPDVPEATDSAWLADLVNNHMSQAVGPAEEAPPKQSVEDKADPVNPSEQSKATSTCNIKSI
jgi:hypothetical protein